MTSKVLNYYVFLSPYLTGLRLFCDCWRQTSWVGRKAISKQSPVIRNFLACVAKWRKVVAKILNMFKNFMRQNSSQNGRKVIAGVSNPSRTWFTSKLRARLVPLNMFKPFSNVLLTVLRRFLFCGFMFHACLCYAVLSVPCSFVITC